MPSYDGAPRFVAKYQCATCGAKWKKHLRSIDEPDPPCKFCKAAPKTPRGYDFNGPTFARGPSISTRAMDRTAEIVMKDYGMTDLRSNQREGDTMAPRLPPAQQDAADNFFKAGSKLAQTNPQAAARVAQMQAAANTGAFAHQPDARAINSIVDRSNENTGKPTGIVTGKNPYRFRKVGEGRF